MDRFKCLFGFHRLIQVEEFVGAEGAGINRKPIYRTFPYWYCERCRIMRYIPEIKS